MELFLSLICGALPPLLLLIYIYRKDSQQPEPFRVLARGVLFGCFSAILSLCLSNSLLNYIRPDIFDNIPVVRGIFAAFYDAALPEESAKLFMLWLLLYNNKEFDESLDAIVYAVCIGMGFAGLENIIFIQQSHDWTTTAIIRGLLAVPGHYIDAVLMGFFYALVYFAPKRFRKYWLLIWLVPFLVHGVYDAICFAIIEFRSLTIILIIALTVFSIKMHHYSIKCIDHIMEIGDGLIEYLNVQDEEYAELTNSGEDRDVIRIPGDEE